MSERNYWLRPTDKLLKSYLWLAELEGGSPNTERKVLAEHAFRYILSLSENENENGESNLSRTLKSASKATLPKEIIVDKLPSSMNIPMEETLMDQVKSKFTKVFNEAKTIHYPYIFRVCAVAYALHLKSENNIHDSENIPNPNDSLGLDILKLSSQITEMVIRNFPKDQEYITQIMEIMNKRKSRDYFEVYPGTPQLSDYKCSVHFGNQFRVDKAKEQVRYAPVPAETIIKYVNAFLQSIGMTSPPDNYSPKTQTSEIDYAAIKSKCHLKDERDIVWIKFTNDGFLGVVAVGTDINFDCPGSREEYDARQTIYNDYYKNYQTVWTHNTSGIIVHQLGKVWDEAYVLIFPLIDIPYGYTRSDIERAVGNMLIDKGVPILDFYSHNY